MSFSTDMAKLVADQLSRFVTLNRPNSPGRWPTSISGSTRSATPSP
jgi:hypothetical protein